MQPSDEDPQGNVLTEEEQALIKMNDSHRNTQNQRPNWKMKIVHHRLNRTEEDSVNKNTTMIT
jgi:hypothetical protein